MKDGTLILDSFYELAEDNRDMSVVVQMKIKEYSEMIGTEKDGVSCLKR
ncbi:MAG: hypothetical protein K6G26_05000 [Lachnospiraceae bacterium]|nr:hypothetical protein [Lachnospiraceae bacterium]